MLQKISKENITDSLLQNIIYTNEKIYIDDFFNIEVAKIIGLDTSKAIMQTLRGDKVAHTIKRHGKNSNLAICSKKTPITLQDIARFTTIVNGADLYSIKKVNDVNLLLSGIQVNGYYVVVESIRKSANELKFKTCYKERGKLIDNKDFTPSNEVRVLTPDGRFYAPRDNLSVELDSSSRASTNNTTTKNTKSQAISRRNRRR
ncbi:PBECR3 domain-containing polyvalent protein [Helicobacter sp. T3_23-1059]